MSYKYASMNTSDNSFSFIENGTLSASHDITNYVFQMASQNRKVSNIKYLSQPADFLIESQRLESEIKKLGLALKKINEMTSRATYFNNEDSKINELITHVSQSVTSIQKNIVLLQGRNDLVFSRQTENMSKHILEILNLRLMEITKEFKLVLDKRAKSIQKIKEKESFFSMAGSKSSEIRSRKHTDAFLKKGKSYDLEGGYGGNNQASVEMTMIQEKQETEHLKRRNESVKSIQKSLEEVMGVFQRISTMVQLHETMIERIDKDMDDSLHNVSAGKKNLVKVYKDMSSTRRMIISAFIFLMAFSTVYILII